MGIKVTLSTDEIGDAVHRDELWVAFEGTRMTAWLSDPSSRSDGVTKITELSEPSTGRVGALITAGKIKLQHDRAGVYRLSR